MSLGTGGSVTVSPAQGDGPRTAAAAGAPVLDVRNLAVEYATHAALVRAVRGVSFSVWVGETVGIVGESGSGKSASALALLRLLPGNGRVSGGQALLRSEDLLTMPMKQLNDMRGGAVAMVYQDPLSALNPVLTVGRQLTEGIERHRQISHKDAERRAVELLDIVGHSECKEAPRRVPPPVQRRHAPAGDDRDGDQPATRSC